MVDFRTANALTATVRAFAAALEWGGGSLRQRETVSITAPLKQPKSKPKKKKIRIRFQLGVSHLVDGDEGTVVRLTLNRR